MPPHLLLLSICCKAVALLLCRGALTSSTASAQSEHLTSSICVCVPPLLQNNMLGAYPFHWHFAGDASGQMATDNSVYRWESLQPTACTMLAGLLLPEAAQPGSPALHRRSGDGSTVLDQFPAVRSCT